MRVSFRPIHEDREGIFISLLRMENQNLKEAISLSDTDGIGPLVWCFPTPRECETQAPGGNRGHESPLVRFTGSGHEVFISFSACNFVHIFRGTRIN